MMPSGIARGHVSMRAHATGLPAGGSSRAWGGMVIVREGLPRPCLRGATRIWQRMRHSPDTPAFPYRRVVAIRSCSTEGRELARSFASGHIKTVLSKLTKDSAYFAKTSRCSGFMVHSTNEEVRIGSKNFYKPGPRAAKKLTRVGTN